jgi:diguanylate cyclase (GGDEF)-like protein/PAS domain S-box-containing protein
MKLMRLPRRLTFRIGLVMGTILLATLFGHTALTEHRQQEVAGQRAAAEATILAHTIAASVVESFLATDYARLESTLQRFVTFSDLRRISVLDREGRSRGEILRHPDGRIEPRLGATVLQPPPTLAGHVATSSATTDHTLLVWHPLLDDEEDNPGWVRLEYDTSVAETAAADLWQASRYAGVAALLLVATGLFGVLAGPVRALARAIDFASRLGQADERLPAYSGPIEIERLYRALNHASRHLAENAHDQRLSASVFDNTNEGILIADAERRILRVNAAFTEITGYSAAEVVGRTPSLLRSGVHDEAFYAAMWRALAARGYWRGEIWNRRKNGELYAEMLDINTVLDDNGKVSHYIGVFGDISDLKATERRLETMAHFDRLTGLPNRSLLMDRLGQSIARAERSGNRLAVGFLDLDGFKPVNDTCGHEVGDQLLIQVAERLGNAVRTGDTVARLGGDEFILLIDELKGLGEIAPTMERVLTAIAEPYTVDGHTLVVTASIGVAVYPTDGDNPRTLLAHADQAMYEAKAGGRNVYLPYRPTKV